MSGTTVRSGTSSGYYLTDPGSNPITIAAGIALTNSNNQALGSQLSTYWTITNYGQLLSSGTNPLSDGILLSGGGGEVTNATSGSISGYDAGVSIAGSGSVDNQGSIASTNTNGSGYTYDNGVFVATTAGVILGGGGISNAASGRITSYLEGVAVDGGGAVFNAGTIVASSREHGFGVVLPNGGSVTNAQGGAIDAGLNGILTFGEAASVINQGSIYAWGNIGAGLIAGGALSNASSGQISGFYAAVYAGGVSASAIRNSGSLYGYYFGVKITNPEGYVANTGEIRTAAVFSSTNANSASAGVQLAGGGIVTNAMGGYIGSKWIGVQIGQSPFASVGGAVYNQGTILAADSSGDSTGVWIHGPGEVSNAAGGVISGGFGIVAYYQTTVVNQGTIFGTRYAFDATGPGYADRVIDTPGAVFSGVVTGGNTLGSAIYSTLELASGSSAGSIANVGTFIDFGQVAIDAGATWSLGGSLAAGETIVFGGADASLILTGNTAVTATISNFAATDTIALQGIGGLTRVSSGDDSTQVVSAAGDPDLSLTFAAAPDLTWLSGAGYTEIFVPCFLPGTLILTDRGEIPVEKLQVGNTIVTLGGQPRRLCWIGEGRAMATRGQRNAATPVIVRKGALADNRPHHDLRITKGHSLYLDGVLIPVEFLVNHRSILWDDRAQEVRVFHLELDAHDVLLANGAAAESYRDDGNRWLFRNANAGWGQPPKAPCAPVLTGGAVVDAVWRRLLDRAGPRPGLPLTEDADVHLVVDGARLDAHQRLGSVLVFRLPRPPASVRIASREAVPAELGLARDPRSLGVAIRHVALRQGTEFMVLRASDPRLVEGFHGYETDANLRWTDGSAALPADAVGWVRGAAEVVLHVAATTRYPHHGTRSTGVAA